MPVLREIINPANVYQDQNNVVRQFDGGNQITPGGMVGDTTSNTYMPYLSAFRGASELVEHDGKRALIYKMRFYQYNTMYSKRSRGFNRDFNEALRVFSSGGKTYLINGDIGCEVYAGLILERVIFSDTNVRTDHFVPLIMLGVKPEYVFSGELSQSQTDPKQFALFINSKIADNPVYAKIYKKFGELIITPLIQYGVRVVYTPDILPEMFMRKTYKQAFSSTGALVDYKRSFNNAIDLGDTVNVDYRYPGAVHHEHGVAETFSLPVPEVHTDHIVNFPGVDGNPFTVTIDSGAIPRMPAEEMVQALRATGTELFNPVEEDFEIID